MKTRSVIFRWISLCLLVLASTLSMSCMTTYDSAGRPVQSVDPGLAVAGVAAAGLVGYAIANDNDSHHHHYRGRGGYYGPYRGPYRRY
jgi:hypothetical protein